MSFAGSSRRGRLRRAAAVDDGFSLVESVVAIAIAMVVFMALAGALGATAKAGLHARQNQNAINLANEQIERFRGIDVTGVAMDAADVSTADANLTDPGTGLQFDPDGAGPEPAERIITTTGGAVNPHQLPTQTLNNTPYQVSVYVTQPAADAVATAEYRRLTVIVTYSRGDLTRERRTSTLLTPTRRGLPLPSFVWGTSDAATVPAGDSVTLPATLTNRGARDAWNLTKTFVPTQTWPGTWFADANGDNIASVGEELTDTNGDGVVDTGLLETDGTARLLLVSQVPSDALGGQVAVRLTATSIAQPLHPDAAQTFDHTVTVVPASGSCTGCTLTAHFLHNTNTTPTADSDRVASMAGNLVPPVATTLFNYDRDVDTVPGRNLATGGGGATDATASRSMTWNYSTTSSKTYGGASARARIWVKSTTPFASFTLNAFLRYRTGGFVTASSASSPVVTDNGNWQLVTIDLPLSADITVGQNKDLQLRLQVTGSAVEVAYDTTTYASDLVLPVRAS